MGVASETEVSADADVVLAKEEAAVGAEIEVDVVETVETTEAVEVRKEDVGGGTGPYTTRLGFRAGFTIFSFVATPVLDVDDVSKCCSCCLFFCGGL